MSEQDGGPVPEKWIELTIRVNPAELLEHAAHLLVESGASAAVEERDAALIVFQPWPPSPEQAVEELRAWLEDALTPAAPAPASAAAVVTVDFVAQEHRDWTHLWKQGLHARRIGRRIVIKPTWIEYTAEPGQVVIAIDPGMAFGTAEHATTRGCLQLLEAAVSTGHRVLDVGTGSAILAIAAVGLGARECIALDSDPLALDAARENVERNAAGAVRLRRMDVTPSTQPRDQFDVVAANMISGLLLPRLGFLRGSMRAGGSLIIGGIESHERDSVVDAVGGHGLRLIDEIDEEGWWSARLRATSDRS